jgi:LysM repeat protein
VTRTEATPDPKPLETAKPAEQAKPAETTQEPAKQETKKPAVKADTTDMNGIQVIVEKPEKRKTETVQPSQKKPEPQQASQPQPQMPEKVNGLNVFVLDPYAIPYNSAYYPYTSRPVYENNKTKFILARAGDTYQKLAVALQLTEKNLRLYNDVYDGSEPIEDEVIYLEQKSTRSSVPYHTLQEGDTYRYIAQRYGIQLKILIKRNSGNINSYSVGDQICIGCN